MREVKGLTPLVYWSEMLVCSYYTGILHGGTLGNIKMWNYGEVKKVEKNNQEMWKRLYIETCPHCKNGQNQNFFLIEMDKIGAFIVVSILQN